MTDVTVKIWKFGEWKNIDVKPVKCGKDGLEWRLAKPQRTVKVRFDFPGSAGIALMNEILSSVRENLPTIIAGEKVVKTVDYLTQTEFDLPPSNVLSFSMEDGSQLIMRPSGTEPKLKIYYSLRADNEQRANEKLEGVQKAVSALLEKAKN
jgi:phosphomannomutase